MLLSSFWYVRQCYKPWRLLPLVTKCLVAMLAGMGLKLVASCWGDLLVLEVERREWEGVARRSITTHLPTLLSWNLSKSPVWCEVFGYQSPVLACPPHGVWSIIVSPPWQPTADWLCLSPQQTYNNNRATAASPEFPNQSQQQRIMI